MSGTIQKASETAVTKRYEALLRVSQTLISIRSSEELFNILARELRAVVSFYVMGVGIYAENAHEVRLTSYGEPGVPLQVPKLAPEETFTWWVYQHQQPLIIPSLDAETRFPAVAEMLKNRGVRSVCALPLTTVHRRLGGLAVGSIEADAYSKEEVSFLSLVAKPSGAGGGRRVELRRVTTCPGGPAREQREFSPDRRLHSRVRMVRGSRWEA